MTFTALQIKEALEYADKLLPEKTPPMLAAACPGVDANPVDEDWPFHNNLEAIRLMLAWNKLKGTPTTVEEEDFRLTHSHGGEFDHLAKYGVDELYSCIYTTYVSVSWHLAGRHTYEAELVKALPTLPPHATLIDFGAAPWVESLYYAKKGLNVIAVNKRLDSDCHQFGKFMAQVVGIGSVMEMESDEVFNIPAGSIDIVYAMDVFEHIPPCADGSPGWIPYAEALFRALKPNGIWYANAPLDKDTTCHPVVYHPSHYTSPISLQEWSDQHGMPQAGTFLRRKPA